MTGSTRAERVLPLTHDDAAPGVLARFRTVLTAASDDAAVIDEQGESTFGQLADEAACVRAAVVARTQPGTPVGVLFGHRTSAVAAILGVLASGRPLIVLDHRTPAARLVQLCERVGAGLVVAGDEQLALAAELGRAVLTSSELETVPRESLWDSEPDPSAPAIYAFTSGSTGRPKVVVNSGAMLVSDAWRNSAATGCYDADDVIAHTLPMAFHAGLMVTVAGLMVGSTMRLYDSRERGITGLAPWISNVGATVMHTSPAILRAFVASGARAEQLTTLRTVTIAGEPAQGRDVERLRPLIPATCVLRNRYGSSETGLIAEYVVDADHPTLEGPLPVGSPVGDTEIVCLTDDGAPLPPGSPGIVSITRDVVASGYLDNPEATVEAFSTRPDGRRTYRTSDVGRMDGDRLTLLGRRDHSVKIRGYLVEPSEVDAALFALPDVVEALTVGARNDTDDRYRLVSYVVCASERPSAAKVRAELRERLPGHLVPEAVVFLDALPRTERGKLDRSALPPAPPTDAGPMPISEWERLVAQVWSRVLGLETISRDADFFALGGDSLAAEELTAAVISDLGVSASDVTSAMIVQAPTLAEYARRLKRRPDRRNQILTVLRADGDLPPLFLVSGGGALGVGFVPLVRHLPEGRPVYAFHSYGLECKAIPDWSIPAVARRNLKTLRTIQPHGPYHLGGHSFGGLVALEMAQQLRAAGEEVAILIELDSFPPQPEIIPPLFKERRSLPRRARDLVGLLVTGLVPHPGQGQFWRFHGQSHALSMRYRTTPYPGRTTVVVADSEDKDVRSAWGPHLSGEWTKVSTPGSHVAMLRDPYAESVAACVVDALASVTPATASEEASPSPSEVDAAPVVDLEKADSRVPSVA